MHGERGCGSPETECAENSEQLLITRARGKEGITQVLVSPVNLRPWRTKGQAEKPL